MNKKEAKELFDGLKICFDETEEIYQLSNLIKKFCYLNKDSDDLYEISEVINIVTEKSNNVSLNLYRIINSNANETVKKYDLSIRDIFQK